MSNSSKRLYIAAVLAAAISIGCDSTSPVGPPSSIQSIGTVPATLTAGLAVPGGISVRLRDAVGRNVSGTKVTLVIAAGDGSLSSHLATSDADGIAHTDWTIGQTAGTNTLVASIVGIDSTATISITGTAGAAAAVVISPRILRLPVGTTTAAVAGAVVDQYSNSISGSTTYTSRNTSLVTVNATTGGVSVVPGASGTTYVVATGNGFADSSLVIVLKVGDTPCTGITASANLAVGDVMTTGFVDNGICIPGTTTGGEYAIVPYFDSSVPSAQTSFTLSAFGVRSVGALGLLRPAVLPVLSSAARTSANQLAAATPFHDRLRAQGVTEMRERAAGARSWYASQRAARGALKATSVPAVGDQLQLNVNSLDFCGNAKMHTGRVAAITDRAIVVADQANPDGFTDAEYKSFGVNFDTLVYALDIANFGDPTDIDNNGGRVVLFFTHAVNEAGPGVLGFFYPRDLLPKVGPLGSCPGSNVGELMYLAVPDPNSGFTKQFVLTNTVSTVAHEFQHLINASRRLYVTLNAAPAEERWLDEGLAHIAEELLFYHVSALAPRQNIGSAVFTAQYFGAYQANQSNNFGRLREYLKAPDQQGPIGTDNEDDDLATRGAIWSFLRYAADIRFSTGEATLWHNLVNGNQTGMQNLNEVIGTDTHLLMRDWTLSIFLDDLVTTAAKYQQPSWNLRAAIVGYAPGTITLTDGATSTPTLRAGGTVFGRFGLNANQEAFVRAAGLGGQPLPKHVLLAVVRTK